LYYILSGEDNRGKVVSVNNLCDEKFYVKLLLLSCDCKRESLLFGTDLLSAFGLSTKQQSEVVTLLV